MPVDGKCTGVEDKCLVDTFCPETDHTKTREKTCIACSTPIITGQGCNCVSGVSSPNCQTCVAGSCSACGKGYFLNGAKDCSICASPCLTCSTDATTCTECIKEFELVGNTCEEIVPSGQCTKDVNKCLADTYCPATSLTEVVCKACGDEITVGQGCNCVDKVQIKNCINCLDGKCDKCISGHYLTISNACSKCSSSCAECEKFSSSCTECFPGFVLDRDSCKPELTDGKCTGVEDKCLVDTFCPETDHTKTREKTCIACSTPIITGQGCNCVSGVSSPNCQTCVAGSCSACGKGYFLNGAKDCSICASPCLTCSTDATTCTECIKEFELVGNTCEEIVPSGQCTKDVNKCLADTYCPATSLTEVVCKACGDEITVGQGCNCVDKVQIKNCINCLDGKCDKCISGHYLTISNACSKCSSSCAECEKFSSSCTECFPGFVLDRDSCKPELTDGKCTGVEDKCLVDTFCPETDHTKTREKTCIACSTPIITGQGCNCVSGVSSPNCQTCVAGSCSACGKGYFLNGAKDCSICASPCLTCSTDATTCTECIKEFELVGNTCEEIVPSGQCTKDVNKCLADTYCPATSLTEVVCKACGDEITVGQGCNCVDKVQIKNCINCLDGKCDKCISGHYLTISNACSKCSSSCAECEKFSSSCTECFPGFVLDRDSCKPELTDGKCTGVEDKCLVDTFCPETDHTKTREKTCIACSTPIITGQGCNCVSGVSSPNCQTCVAGSCSACGKGYFLNGAKDCSICASPCLTCSTDATTCTECIKEFELVGNTCEEIVPSGQCTKDVNKCLADTYCPATSLTEVVCKACGDEITVGQGCNCVDKVQIKNCINCLDGKCDKCISGHYLTISNACSKCSSSCAECEKFSSSCTECFPGFVLDRDSCKPELTDGKCTGVEDKCLVDTFCPETDHTKTREKTCIACSTPIITGQGCNCVSGVSSPNCQTCVAGSCSACGKGYFLNGAKDCSICASPCLTCSTDATACTECIKEFELVGNTCEEIVPSGQCTKDVNKCLADTYCPATSLTEVVCKACGDEITVGQGCNCVDKVQIKNCINCLDGKCDKCISGHYLTISNACSKCSSSCAECEKFSSSCTECFPGFVLDRDSCKPELTDGKCTGVEDKCLVDTFCPETDHTKTREKTCIACSTPIITGQGCNCVSGVSSPNCQTCVAGSCSACGKGYFLNGAKDCSICASPCLTCSTDATTCTECIKEFELVGNTCEEIVPSGQCTKDVNKCLADTYCPATSLTEVVCKACGDEITVGQGCNCVDKVQIKNCINCLDGKCDKCISGHYLTISNACSKCSSSCAECEKFSSSCTECFPGFVLDRDSCKPELTDGKCTGVEDKCLVDTFCPETDHTKTREKTCIACSTPIITGQGCNCVSGVSSPNCQTCVAGSCSACGKGYFLNGAKDCSICASPCLTCSTDATTCTECIEGYQLNQNKCEISVPAGKCNTEQNKCGVDTFCPATSKIEVNCKPCGSDIMVGQGCNCKENTMNVNCQTCASNNCSVCISGYFVNSSKVCSVCASPCLECTTNATTCTSCIKGYELVAKQCKKIVPSGMCTETTNKCEINTFCPATSSAEVSCKQCGQDIKQGQGCNCETNTMNVNCKTCASNGCSTCISQYYVTSQKKCSSCSSPCLECTETANTCTSCVSGYELVGKKCNKIVPSGRCTDISNKCKSNTFCPATSSKEVDCEICSESIQENQGCNCVSNIEDKNCQICENSSCSKCISKHFLSSQKSCQKCMENCSECTSLVNCDVCFDGHEFDGLKCAKTCETGHDCSRDMFCDNSTLHCDKCENNCEKCLSKTICGVCKSGQYPNISGVCERTCKLSNGQYCKDGTAITCAQGMTSECKCDNAKNCATCIEGGSLCDTCLPGFKKDGKNCIQCDRGYERFESLCVGTGAGAGKAKAGLSVGAIAGIAVAAVIVVGAIGGGAGYYFVKKNKKTAFMSDLYAATQ